MMQSVYFWEIRNVVGPVELLEVNGFAAAETTFQQFAADLDDVAGLHALVHTAAKETVGFLNEVRLVKSAGARAVFAQIFPN